MHVLNAELVSNDIYKLGGSFVMDGCVIAQVQVTIRERERDKILTFFSFALAY